MRRNRESGRDGWETVKFGQGTEKGMASTEESKTARLGRQMMTMSILVSLAPLFISTLVLFYYYHVVYTDKVVAHMEELGERHAQSIDSYLSEKLSNIKSQILSYSEEELLQDAFLEQRLRLLQSVYRNAYNDLGLINAHGRLLAYAGPFRLGSADYADTDWFKSAIKAPEFISDVFLGFRRIPHFIITVRKYTDGQPWLLRATIDFAGFNALVKEINLGTTGQAFIINRKKEFQTELRRDENIEPSILDKIVEQKFLSGQAAFMEAKSQDGREFFYVSAPLKNGEWILVIQQERSDALYHLYTARKIALSIVVLGSLGIILTVVLLTRRMQSKITMVKKDQEAMEKQVVETGKLAAIGELAAGIAHEINNPVAIMMESAGWVQDLMKQNDMEKAETRTEITETLKEIVLQGRRCKEITHKLLSFARRTDSRVSEVNVNELLEEIISLTSQKARYGGVSVRTELTSESPVIMGSPTELQQVTLNLINNAIDAIEKPEGVVAVRSRLEGKDVVIDVADNGKGIPQADLVRIFEPFYTTKPVGKGTGLGLSICYGIINKMGGEITVESELDEGTVFHVRIPMSR